jgi:lipoprotein-anchoring transpeptidase ErfK/SrfK
MVHAQLTAVSAPGAASVAICRVYVMKIIAVLACGAAALLFNGQSSAMAQNANRYARPPAVVLSPDLTAPWLLQLSNKPQAMGRPSVMVSTQPRPAKTRNPFFAPFQQRTSAIVPMQRRQVGAMAIPGSQAATVPAMPVRLEQGRKAKAAQPEFDPKFEMQIVEYSGGEAPGTIIIDTEARFLYLVEGNGTARRYGVGVGRPGFEWAGEHKVTRKAEWPAWTPPPQMIEREREKGKILPPYMEGGPENPLGARALYLGDSLYRIHGTNQPWSIGQAVSSGCIRMRNEDVIDLYERVRVGTKVVVS